MPNSNYNKGRAFEYRVKHYYERAGFFCARTAGSHSPADLIAWREVPTSHGVDVVLIQCKRGKKKSYAAAKDELRKIPGPNWWRRVLWESEGRKTYMHDLAGDWREEVDLHGQK